MAAVLERFGRPSRALHWATATAVLTAALTGMILYFGPLTALVGRRHLVKDIHVVAGLAMPVPLILAYAGTWRRDVRANVRSLARWTRADRRWLRTRGREAGDKVGKFNGGQKANAAFVAGMIPIMLVSGSIMRWFEPWPVQYRTGATFVHDWTAIVTWVVVAGHILFAVNDPESLRGMLTGRVARAWARDHHPRWAAELDPEAGADEPDEPEAARVGDAGDHPLR